MTVEEFFEWRKRQDRNYELVDGVPVLTVKAMTGASARHDTVTVNAITTFSNRLRGKPCRPRTSDQSITTFRGTRRPDVSVECGTPDDNSMEVANPTPVVEILSPSTTRYDRFQKLEKYKEHGKIRLILIVDTEAPRVTVWRRAPEGNWTHHEEAGLEALIALPEIQADLALTDLYRDIAFSPE